MTPSLHLSYNALRQEAERLAGAPGDIPQRVRELHNVFVDSGGNHSFPEVALHGALWAYTFFEAKGKLGRIIQWRYFYNKKERNYRMGLLRGFAEGFKEANRLVFIDTWTNYWFSKSHGLEPEASQFVPAEMLAHLNKIHAAARQGTLLPADERRAAFITALRQEQECTVAPRIEAELNRFTCPILTALCMKPVVRFKYFPKGKKFWFRNFSDVQERIEKATAAFDFAESAGWKKVEESMKGYGVAL
jgi:hypothetical protein